MPGQTKAGRPPPKSRTVRTIFLLLVTLFATTSLPQETTLRSQSNVVLIPALVKDREGGIVYGLQDKDFIVEDDGVEQGERLDEAPEGQPISLVGGVQLR